MAKSKNTVNTSDIEALLVKKDGIEQALAEQEIKFEELRDKSETALEAIAKTLYEGSNVHTFKRRNGEIVSVRKHRAKGDAEPRFLFSEPAERKVVELDADAAE